MEGESNHLSINNTMSTLEIRIRVAAIIIENNKILLIAHQKDNTVYWLLPGGGVNPGESLEEALKRELKEELDIIVDVNDVALICDSISPDNNKHILNICFFCSHNTGNYLLNREQRLYSFGFYEAECLDGLQIFPPIKTELKNILYGLRNNIYRGKRWVKL